MVQNFYLIKCLLLMNSIGTIYYNFFLTNHDYSDGKKK